jgi:hypothetical protein
VSNRQAVRLYIVRVTEGHIVRLFSTIASDFEQAIYNVKAEHSFWNTERYSIKTIAIAKQPDEVVEIK